MPRRFPAPWSFTPSPSGYRIEDSNGVLLAYVYGDDTKQGVNSTKLTLDEARRIASGIARLPALLLAKPGA